jgi:hypothetical protein
VAKYSPCLIHSLNFKDIIMRKIILAAAIATSALGLAACGETANEAGDLDEAMAADAEANAEAVEAAAEEGAANVDAAAEEAAVEAESSLTGQTEAEAAAD